MAELEEKLNAILGNPDAMGQIMALARSLNGGGDSPAEQSTPPPEPGESPPPSPASQMGTPDLSALLRALRPFVREERRAGLDRALQIVGVTRIIRAALETMGGKGEEGRV